ncbi:MAG: hypothetical protein QME66_05980 [Candidatus Eisenbacteria bacterium]|nr:hypothetical protein [Candidatus Eisenbacteria bacterium]
MRDEGLQKFMQEVQRDLGTLLEGQKNQGEHITWVSKKIDANTRVIQERLDAHVSDQDAHGLKTMRSSKNQGVAVAALVISLLAAAANILAVMNGLSN